MSQTPLRVVFMGTPDFAVPCLQILLDNPQVANVVAVYTQPDRPAGRGMELKAPPVKDLAQKYNLPVFQPENINRNDEPRKLADLMADVIVVVAYAQFLGKAVLNLPRLGCVNVHGSLLPKYRGAAPIQYTVLNGEKEAGVTTMKLVEKMDAGPMLIKRAIPIDDKITSGELYPILSKIGAQALLDTLTGIRDRTLNEEVQDEAQATYATLLKKEMGELDFRKPAKDLHNLVRAFQPWPGTYAKSSKGNIKIHKTEIVKESAAMPHDAKPGSIFATNKDVFIKCGDDWLRILMLQMEGKKQVTGEQFINGIQGESKELQFF